MTSVTSYSAEVKARREHMRRARNAAFYQRHSGGNWQKWRDCVREQVRLARAANRRAVARLSEWRHVSA